MINTIIVPTDGSEHAKKALNLAAELAEKFDARLVLVHVLLHHTSTGDLRKLCDDAGGNGDLLEQLNRLDDAVIEASAAAYGPVPLPVPPELLRQIGELITGNARRVAETNGVSAVTTTVIDGKPAETIITVAENERADMIVMGRRGLGNITGLLMGSVSHKVSHLADCACVTVK